MHELRDHIAAVANGASLTRAQAREVFGLLFEGEATEAQIGGLLMALRVRGETVDEIAGAVDAMRSRMLPVPAPDHAIDIVGTGGDASGSYNISTCAALVAAAAGATVAKHGNRALSSKSGAADTLEALGVNLADDPAIIARCIASAGVGFMFAPVHHAAVRHVGPARAQLGTRTIFNLLGPLSNPAGTKRQLIGVFDPKWLEPLAEVLRDLGSETVWIVHGDGMDEMTVTGETRVAALRDGNITTFTVTPEDADLPRHDISELRGGDAEQNAAALRAVLAGEPSAYRDMTVLNAAAGLVVADLAADLREGAVLAATAIDDGSARQTLADLVEISNETA